MDAARRQEAAAAQARSDTAGAVSLGQGAVSPLAQLLGVDTASTPIAQEMANAPDWDAYLAQNPALYDYFEKNAGNLRKKMGITTPQQLAEEHYNRYGRGGPVPTMGERYADQQGGTLSTQPVSGGSLAAQNTGGDTQLEQLFQTVPGAQAAFDKALEGVQQSSYAQGKTGGNVLKELMGTGLEYGTALRQNEINNLFNALNQGTSTSINVGSIGTNAAANAGRFNLEGADARASGYANNPWATGLGTLAGFFSSDAGSDLIGGIGDWWKRRTGGGSASSVPGVGQPIFNYNLKGFQF